MQCTGPDIEELVRAAQKTELSVFRTDDFIFYLEERGNTFLRNVGYLSSTRSLSLGRRNIIHQRMVLYNWSVGDMGITGYRVFRNTVFYWSVGDMGITRYRVFRNTVFYWSVGDMGIIRYRVFRNTVFYWRRMIRQSTQTNACSLMS